MKSKALLRIKSKAYWAEDSLIFSTKTLLTVSDTKETTFDEMEEKNKIQAILLGS